jgi:hypothetical protein
MTAFAAMIMPMMFIMVVAMAVAVRATLPVRVAMAMCMIVVMGMIGRVAMIVCMAMVVAMAVVMGMTMIMVVDMFCRCIHIPAGVRVENVEFGAHQAVLAYFARPHAKPFHPQGCDMFANQFYIRSGVDQCAHEHVAAHAGGSIEIENFFHFCCSFSLIPMAILLIMSAW